MGATDVDARSRCNRWYDSAERSIAAGLVQGIVVLHNNLRAAITDKEAIHSAEASIHGKREICVARQVGSGGSDLGTVTSSAVNSGAECLGYVIPLSERHLRKTLREWVTHYNQGRPRSALGPGIPADTKERLRRPIPHTRRHELPADSRITTREILGGLHHEYELEQTAA